MSYVVMIGPSPTSKGGMATVSKNLLDNGYESAGYGRFLPTHVEGGVLRKAACALGSLLRFMGWLITGKVALLHVHVASGVSFWRKALFIGAAQLFRRPVLFHLHGGHFIEYVDHELSGWRQRLARRLIGRSRAALALTRESAAWLEHNCGIAEVEVFPNPMNLVPLAPVPVPRGRDIVFMARIEAAKGVFDLLDAFASVVQSQPQARLIICGKGDIPAVQARAAVLGLTDKVVIEGWIDSARRAELLASAAVFALPSYEEQMPMAILEALAAGTPVVGSEAGAIPEILEYGNIGTVVPINNIGALSDALRQIMDDNVHADTLSARGLQRIEDTYLVGSVLRRLQRRYQELLT